MAVIPQSLRPAPSERACGDTLDWGRWVPAMWQALADPDGRHPWAPRAKPHDDQFADTDGASRWVPATQLLQCSLGWSDPGRGLRWWYDNGQPTDDPRFALLAECSAPILTCSPRGIGRHPTFTMGLAPSGWTRRGSTEWRQSRGLRLGG